MQILAIELLSLAAAVTSYATSSYPVINGFRQLHSFYRNSLYYLGDSNIWCESFQNDGFLGFFRIDLTVLNNDNVLGIEWQKNPGEVIKNTKNLLSDIDGDMGDRQQRLGNAAAVVRSTYSVHCEILETPSCAYSILSAILSSVIIAGDRDHYLVLTFSRGSAAIEESDPSSITAMEIGLIKKVDGDNLRLLNLSSVISSTDRQILVTLTATKSEIQISFGSEMQIGKDPDTTSREHSNGSEADFPLSLAVSSPSGLILGHPFRKNAGDAELRKRFLGESGGEGEPGGGAVSTPSPSGKSSSAPSVNSSNERASQSNDTTSDVTPVAEYTSSPSPSPSLYPTVGVIEDSNNTLSGDTQKWFVNPSPAQLTVYLSFMAAISLISLYIIIVSIYTRLKVRVHKKSTGRFQRLPDQTPSLDAEKRFAKNSEGERDAESGLIASSTHRSNRSQK